MSLTVNNKEIRFLAWQKVTEKFSFLHYFFFDGREPKRPSRWARANGSCSF